MDLLASMNLEDLPEQQTLTVALMEKFPDFDFRLGWDACCACGKALLLYASSSEGGNSHGDSTLAVGVPCPGCRRVNYCSDACRIQDASVGTTVLVSEDEDRERNYGQLLHDEGDRDDDDSRGGGRARSRPPVDHALGHSPVICALLSLCDDDEAVEAGNYEKFHDSARLEAAKDRVRSEDESYPATLANVLSEGPCYKSVIARCRNTNKALVLHVVGASIDSEFWGYDGSDDDSTDRSTFHRDDGEDSSTSDSRARCFEAYADALAELGVVEIELVFVGPECPSVDLVRHVPIERFEGSGRRNRAGGGGDRGRDSAGGDLVIRSVRGLYSRSLLQSRGLVAKPDIVVFFNPGFTVPEYDWRETLASIDPCTPFLSTTNTELEGIADCQFLLDQDKIQSLPDGLAEIFGLYSPGDDTDNLPSSADADVSSAFFNVNPFSGNRVRQSGTMANDLYVKNRWILGGIIDTFDPSRISRSSAGSSKKQRVAINGSNGNKKLNNPALV
jgi:hypothetical protein